jgi:hypothetical protein
MPRREFFVVNHFMPSIFVFLILRNFYCYIRKYNVDPDMKKALDDPCSRDIHEYDAPSFLFPSDWMQDPVYACQNLQQALASKRVTHTKAIGCAEQEKMTHSHLFIGYKNLVFVYISELFFVPASFILTDALPILAPSRLTYPAPMVNEGYFNRIARLSINSSCVCGREYPSEDVDMQVNLAIRAPQPPDSPRSISSEEY